MIRATTLAVLLAASYASFAAEEAKIKPDLAKAKAIAESVCIACHGADGNSALPTNPILAGQGAEYLLKQLTEFKAPEGKLAIRNNPVMAGMTSTLSREDMQGLAQYFRNKNRNHQARQIENWLLQVRTCGAKATSSAASRLVQAATDQAAQGSQTSIPGSPGNMPNTPSFS